MLDVKRGRWDFPELKRIAKEQYDLWQPDNVLIEAKASGISLQQELRRMNIPVTMYSPGGRRTGTDKVARANAVAPVFEAGMVWAPDETWADERHLTERCGVACERSREIVTCPIIQERPRGNVKLYTYRCAHWMRTERNRGPCARR